MCTHSCLLYSFPLVLFGDTLLLLSSRRRRGVHPELPGVRGLLGSRLPVDVPMAPRLRVSYLFMLSHICIRHFVIHVINNIRTHFIISFFVICAMIYCSFCCIYMWLDPGTYMIARFMSFCKPDVTSCKEVTGLDVLRCGTFSPLSHFPGTCSPNHDLTWPQLWIDALGHLT